MMDSQRATPDPVYTLRGGKSPVSCLRVSIKVETQS